MRERPMYGRRPQGGGGPNKRPRRDPIFEGMPSPALRRMLRWPPDKLKGYIDNLELERQRLNARLQQTKVPLQSTDPRIALEQRLGKLIDKAKELLAAKRLA